MVRNLKEALYLDHLKRVPIPHFVKRKVRLGCGLLFNSATPISTR